MDEMRAIIRKIIEAEQKSYFRMADMCMVYISGLEITQEKESIAQKSILMSDGIPLKTIFQDNIKKIKYIYPNPDKTKSVAIHFKVINPAFYSCSITYNYKDEDIISFSQSKIPASHRTRAQSRPFPRCSAASKPLHRAVRCRAFSCAGASAYPQNA